MKQVTLNVAYLGYTTGELTGKMDGYKYEIKLPNGKLIYLFEDEYTVD